MPALALVVYLALAGYLIVRDCQRRKSVSAAVWIPTVLLLILGSRPVSLWVSGGKGFSVEMGNESAANPLDQIFNLSVIVASYLVASSRGVSWSRIFKANTAIMLFYLYFAVSIAWSGDPMGSFKRLLKDFSLLFVIGVIASEKDPLEAMRAVYVRCAYVLIPLSVVFIKYFPEYSRAYTIGGEVTITGATTQKNSLGEIVLVFTLFLFWDFFETRRLGPKQRRNRIPWDHIVLLIMGMWLLHLSQSKTALLCTVAGVFLLARSGRLARTAVNRAAIVGALSLPFLLFFSQAFSSVIAPFIEALGRDMTFTGRANIWQHVTINTVNPLIGAGYWNFWGGPGGYAISQAMDTVIPNAHCGYVDIYLDGGVLGLVVLFVMLTGCGFRIVRYLKKSSDADRYLRMRLAVMVVAIMYNLSESTFARMGPIWFTTLLMMVDLPMKPAAKRVAMAMRQNVRLALSEKSSIAARPWN
jgi:exopolysaccharide production protein ExoQ